LDLQKDAEAAGSPIEPELVNKDELKHTEQLQNRRDKSTRQFYQSYYLEYLAF
jgi:hypothetical protein